MKTVVIFSGAGLSKESGIPTFRDSVSGLWENYKVEEVATQEGWKANKELVLAFYRDRTNNVKGVQPNAGHYALAKLEQKFKVVNITQNIDDLLERAGCTDVWHLHGDVNHRKCEWHKDISNLDGDMQFTCDYKIIQDKPVVLGDICPKCGGQLRPDVVWFGEAVNMRDREIFDLMEETKVFIGCGTSAQVHPAASLLHTFNHLPKDSKFFIDVNPPMRLQSWTLVQGSAAEKLPEIVDQLLASEK
jgi:NAD-dependent deacetylase